MKTELSNLSPLVEASKVWRIDQKKEMWLKQVYGKIFFSETEPNQEEFFCVLKACSDLNDVPDVDIPTCFVEFPSGLHDLILPNSWDINAPYIGRPYILGKFDCYTLVADYMKREFGFEMEYLTESRERLMTNLVVDNIFLDNCEIGSWKRVIFPSPGDGILFCVGATSTSVIETANHCGIYLGDDKFLHHMQGRSSCIDEFDDSWKQWVVSYMRRKTNV